MHMSNRQKAGRPARRGGMRMSPLPWIALAIVVVAAAAFILLQTRAAAVQAEITAAEAYEKYQAGAFFRDVRTEGEYATAHIAKSVLIPLDELENRLNEVPRDQDVVVICRSGAR